MRRDARGVGWTRVVAFLAIAAVGCAVDLITKSEMFSWRGLPGASPVWWLWEPYVGVENSLNTGAVFGSFGGFAQGFAVLSVAALAFIVYWLFWAGAARVWLFTISLGCIAAGVLGNLYDRLGWWAPAELPAHIPRHAVRDWILLRFGEFTWPNFNIADSLLVCATAALVWHALFLEQRAARSAEDGNDASSDDAERDLESQESSGANAGEAATN